MEELILKEIKKELTLKEIVIIIMFKRTLKRVCTLIRIKMINAFIK